MVRIALAACAALIGCLFVLCYNGIMYHNVVEHYDSDIPGGTRLIDALAGWAFAIPILTAILGVMLAMSHERSGTPVLLLTQLCWLFALAWPLACILAWELPFIILSRGVS